MRRGLIIFLAVMALIFSVVLCACEKPEYIDPSVDPIEDLTELVSEAGVVITGDTFPDGATIEFKEVTDKELLDEINTKIENQTDLNMYYDTGKAVLTVMKVVELSIYNGDEKWDANNSLTYRIPFELLGIKNQSDSYDYKLFKLNSNSFVKYIDTFSYNYNLGWSFTTAQPKYLVLVKTEAPPCKHDNMGSLTDGYDATFFNKGSIRYSYCWDCRKYFDENGNGITSEETEIPVLTHEIELHVNGEKKCDCSIVSEDDQLIKWQTDKITLHKGDYIEVFTNEETPIKCAYTSYDTSLVDQNGKMVLDVNDAQMLLEVKRYGNLIINVSGVDYYYAKSDQLDSCVFAYTDAHDIIALGNIALARWENIKFYGYINGEHKDLYVSSIDTALSSDVVIVENGYLYFYKQGKYNISFNVTTKVATVELVEELPATISGGVLYLNNGYGSCTGIMSYYDHTRDSLDRLVKIYSTIYATNSAIKGSCYEYSIRNSNGSIVDDFIIAEDSKEYIEFDNETNKLRFIKYGVYDLVISESTHEVQAIYKGDDTPEIKIKIDNYDTTKKLHIDEVLKETEESNVVVYESNSIIYAGEVLQLWNKKDHWNWAGQRFVLEEESDSQYVLSTYDSYSRAILVFKVSGVYNIYFDTNTGKIDFELVRAINANENLLPTTLTAFWSNGTNGGETNLISNPNNSNEYCVKNYVVILDDAPADASKTIKLLEFRDSIGTPIRDITSEDTLIDEASIYQSRERYGLLAIKATGIYNIYINIYTHVVRVEKL